MKFNLFLFPFAGGNIYSYRSLMQCAPPAIRPIALELPGRGDRAFESQLTELDAVVDDLFFIIRERLSEPYAFFGHSMGTILSYLVVRKIRKLGLPLPAYLFMSGGAAPSSSDRNSMIKSDLPREDFYQRLKAMGGHFDEVYDNEDAMLYLEPILRADCRLLEQYNHQVEPSFNIPVTIFYGREENLTPESIDLWRYESSCEVKIRSFPGKHFFIFDHPKDIMSTVWKEVDR